MRPIYCQNLTSEQIDDLVKELEPNNRDLEKIMTKDRNNFNYDRLQSTKVQHEIVKEKPEKFVEDTDTNVTSIYNPFIELGMLNRHL